MDAGPDVQKDGSTETDAGPDETAPRVVIDSAPARGLLVPSARFTFSCAESPCSFSCRVDDDAFAPCESPHDTRPTVPGNHSFEVRAERAGQIGASERRAFTNHLPYSVVHADQELIAEDRNGDLFVTSDVRCTRVGMTWQGEQVLDSVRPDPFQCPAEQWLERVGVDTEPEYRAASGYSSLGVAATGDYVLHTRLRKPAADPAPWPDGSYVEQARRVLRAASDNPPPVPETGVDDAGVPLGAMGRGYAIEMPTMGSTCPPDAIASLYGPDLVGTQLYTGMFASAPPDPAQPSTSCTARVPLTLQGGWNTGLLQMTTSGDSEGNAMAQVQLEIDGEELIDARVDPATGSFTVPISLVNWEPCPVTRELTMRADLGGLVAVENVTVFVFLDEVRLQVLDQGVFSWQSCAP